MKWTDELVIEFAKIYALDDRKAYKSANTIRDKLSIFKLLNKIGIENNVLFDKKNVSIMNKYVDFINKNYKDLTINDITTLNNFVIYLKDNNLINNEE